MPTYEYECKSCGNRFDKFHQMSKEPVTQCPECGGSVHKLLSGGAGVIMKGGGGTRARPSCGRDMPCCSADVPCGVPPCHE